MLIEVEDNMNYRTQNPGHDQIEAFLSLRAKGDLTASVENLEARIVAGKTKLSDLWMILNDHEEILVAFTLTQLPMSASSQEKICVPRTQEQLDAHAIKFFLGWLMEASNEGGFSTSMSLSSVRNATLGDIAQELGWIKESHSLAYRTDLRSRTDLKPDEKAVEFGLGFLLEEGFLDFFTRLEQLKDESQAKKSALRKYQHYATHFDVRGYYFAGDAGGVMAAGLVGRQREDLARIELIGVLAEDRGKGWGTRLHRHLMWAARSLANEYAGATDYDNLAMKAIFEKNGCSFAEEQMMMVYRAA